MLKVKDVMTTKVITVTPDTETIEVAKLLIDNRINGMPVVDDKGRVVGIICQSDLIAQQKKLPLPSIFTVLDVVIPITSQKSFEREVQKIVASKVAQAMTPHPITVVNPESTLEEVARLMVDKKLHTLPVMDKGKLVGIIGKEDILRTLLPREKGEETKPGSSE